MIRTLKTLGGLAALTALAGCEGALADVPRHVILVTVDGLSPDHLASDGGATKDLVAGGTIFPNAFAPCALEFPALATLLTGRPPPETCVLEDADPLPASARTLAEILKDAGFATAAFVASPGAGPGSGIDQGFEEFETGARAVEAARAWLAGRDLEHGPPVFVWIHLGGSTASGELSADLVPGSLFVLTATRGEKSPARAVAGPALRVPLLFRCPSTVAAGRRIDDVVSLEDVVPTVLGLLKLDPGSGIHGASLVHELRGGRADPRAAFGVGPGRVVTARRGRWRLVRGPTSTPPATLFDATTDPEEVQDVAAEHPDVVAELEAAIRGWQEKLAPCGR
jgi:arylsulfatase A-like enzyme